MLKLVIGPYSKHYSMTWNSRGSNDDLTIFLVGQATPINHVSRLKGGRNGNIMARHDESIKALWIISEIYSLIRTI